MTSRKRNIWSNEETNYFLKLIKENDQILGFMKGKRLRGVNETFKTLVAPMKEAGYSRDALNLQIKWKNLKAEYYKIKRDGNPTYEKLYPYWDDLDQILRKEPTSKKDFYSSHNSQDNISVKVEDISDEAEPETYSLDMVYKNEPDWDEAGPSNSLANDTHLPSVEITRIANFSKNPREPDKQLSGKRGETCEEVFRRIQMEFAKQMDEQRILNQELLEYFFRKQEDLMARTVDRFLEGIEKIFRENCQPQFPH